MHIYVQSTDQPWKNIYGSQAHHLKYYDQALSGDFEDACSKMHKQIRLGVMLFKVYFSFSKVYNFIAGIVHIYIVFLKIVAPLFL